MARKPCCMPHVMGNLMQIFHIKCLIALYEAENLPLIITYHKNTKHCNSR